MEPKRKGLPKGWVNPRTTLSLMREVDEDEERERVRQWFSKHQTEQEERQYAYGEVDRKVD